MIRRNPGFLREVGDEDQSALHDLRKARGRCKEEGMERTGIVHNYTKDGAMFCHARLPPTLPYTVYEISCVASCDGSWPGGCAGGEKVRKIVITP